jgi:hypothetical protein
MIIDSGEVKDLRNLQRVIKKCLISKWSLFSIYRGEPSTDDIAYFSEYLRNFIKENDKYYLKTATDKFKELNDRNTILFKQYQNADSRFRKLENSEQLIEVYNILLEIGESIYNWVNSKDIQTLGEMKVIYYKLNSIRNIIYDEDLRVRGSLNVFINYFRFDGGDMEYYANSLSKRDLGEDVKKLKVLKYHIKSILA